MHPEASLGRALEFTNDPTISFERGKHVYFRHTGPDLASCREVCLQRGLKFLDAERLPYRGAPLKTRDVATTPLGSSEEAAEAALNAVAKGSQDLVTITERSLPEQVWIDDGRLDPPRSRQVDAKPDPYLGIAHGRRKVPQVKVESFTWRVKAMKPKQEVA